MARPRKKSDPNQWPVPCDRCGEHHQIVANWPDGGVCGYCYQQAKRACGTCACGHEGVLPGRVDGQPACRSCSGVKLNIDCKACGAEDELYRGSRCWSCELAVLVDQLLTNPDTGVMAAELVPVAAALKSMKRSNSGVTWIRQCHVTAFLKDLAVAPTITHEKLDCLPGADRTRNYIRGLLVEHGALPRRDELAVRYHQWATGALDRVSSDDDRDVVRRYIRWHHQRRMNQVDSVPHGTFLRSKQTVTVTIEFLNWLHDHGIALEELRQEHLDVWLADGPSTRRFIDRFIPWAIKCRLVDPELTIARHRRGTSPKLPKSEQDAAVERVHVDIKKLGKIPDGGGWRITGRGSAQDRRAGVARDRAARQGALSSRGYVYLHHAVDDHSRLAYSEILSDDRKETAAAFWKRAQQFFARHGITVKAILTDNGACYRSRLWAKTLGTRIKHRRTRPYRPQTNGKVERFNRTLLEEWAYACAYTSEADRRATYPEWLHHYNHHRGHTSLKGQSPIDRVPNLSGQNS